MKAVVNIELPIEPFNSMVKKGTAGPTIASIIEVIKPEVVYFYAPNGCRGGVMVVDIKDASQIPSIAEPFFLQFGAKCEFNIAMSPEDLANSGLDKLGKQWGHPV